MRDISGGGGLEILSVETFGFTFDNLTHTGYVDVPEFDPDNTLLNHCGSWASEAGTNKAESVSMIFLEGNNQVKLERGGTGSTLITYFELVRVKGLKRITPLTLFLASSTLSTVFTVPEYDTEKSIIWDRGSRFTPTGGEMDETTFYVKSYSSTELIMTKKSSGTKIFTAIDILEF